MNLREKIINLPVSLYPDQVDEIYKGCVAWFREEIEKVQNPYGEGNNYPLIHAFEECRDTVKDLLKTLEGK